jgi:putative GTP pyrophosphokinase
MEFQKSILRINNVLNKYPNSDLVKNIKGFVLQQQIYNAAIKEIKTKLEILDTEFQVMYDYNPIHHMEYRLKSPESIIEKLNKRKLEISLASIRKNFNDVAGVRVICNYIDDIFHIADLLINQDDIKLLEKKDYITHPKKNGYRSLHLIVEVPIYLAKITEKVPVEIQVRTIAMDFWASLEHQLKYKSQNTVSDNLHQRLRNCAESITLLDSEMQYIFREMKSENQGLSVSSS